MRKPAKKTKSKAINTDSDKSVTRNVIELLFLMMGILLVMLSTRALLREAWTAIVIGNLSRNDPVLSLFSTVGLIVGLSLIIKRGFPLASLWMKYSVLAVMAVSAIFLSIRHSVPSIDVLRRCGQIENSGAGCAEARFAIVLAVTFALIICIFCATLAFYFYDKNRQEIVKKK
jgi:uncharacterized membrane protein